MTRATALLTAFLACLLGACTADGDLLSRTGTPSSTVLGQPNGEPKTIRLTRGRDVVTYPIVALDPPTHTFSVRIEAPGRPDLSVWFTTRYGATLHVTSRSRRDSACSETDGDTNCLFRFAELEAQHAGSWVIHVRKRSLEPATVTTTVRFEATDA